MFLLFAKYLSQIMIAGFYKREGDSGAKEEEEGREFACRSLVNVVLKLKLMR